MYVYDEECLKTFIEKQSQLYDQPVAETLEEADAFLDDCMAVVVDSIAEVKEYLDESGADVEGMSDEEIEEACEVFSLPSGRYLVVEGQKDESHSLVGCGFLVMGFSLLNMAEFFADPKNEAM